MSMIKGEREVRGSEKVKKRIRQVQPSLKTNFEIYVLIGYTIAHK
jgi:hypothetical protein